MRELSVVEQRYQAVLAVISDGETVTDVAARFGVRRQTVHGWLARYEGGGLDALVDRSHRPRSCPHQMDPAVEVRLVELIFPHQTNHYGTLFGGHALGLMDKAGYLSATRFARRTMVTVASDRVEFKVPVRAGQMVELVAVVERTTTGAELARPASFQLSEKTARAAAGLAEVVQCRTAFATPATATSGPRPQTPSATASPSNTASSPRGPTRPR